MKDAKFQLAGPRLCPSRGDSAGWDRQTPSPRIRKFLEMGTARIKAGVAQEGSNSSAPAGPSVVLLWVGLGDGVLGRLQAGAFSLRMCGVVGICLMGEAEPRAPHSPPWAASIPPPPGGPPSVKALRQAGWKGGEAPAVGPEHF